MKTLLLLSLAGVAIVAVATPAFLSAPEAAEAHVAPETQPVTTVDAPAFLTDPDDCRVEGTIPVADDAAVTPDLARITADDAEGAALAAVPGAVVTGTELDEEDGFLVYEIDLLQNGAEVDVTVDAGTGEVVCTDRD